MVKENNDSLDLRREMSTAEELQYLARYSIRTYNNSMMNPGFLEHAYRECVKNQDRELERTLALEIG